MLTGLDVWPHSRLIRAVESAPAPAPASSNRTSGILARNNEDMNAATGSGVRNWPNSLCLSAEPFAPPLWRTFPATLVWGRPLMAVRMGALSQRRDWEESDDSDSIEGSGPSLMSFMPYD